MTPDRRRTPYEDTSVSTGDSMSQLDKLLVKAGIAATRWTTRPGTVCFEFQPKEGGDGFRIEVPIRAGDTERESEQNRRQAFRILFWYIKSKLEAVDVGLADWRREFLAYMITGPSSVFVDHVNEAAAKGLKVLPLGQGSPLLTSGETEGPPERSRA